MLKVQLDMNTMGGDAVYEPTGFDMIGESKPVEANLLGCSMSKFWESQHNIIISSNVQMSVVQGRLKSHVMFWQEVLQDPPFVMDWICKGTNFHCYICQNHILSNEPWFSIGE